jgi:outer membrane protein OmpA-like peptidoglycan-associated protein
MIRPGAVKQGATMGKLCFSAKIGSSLIGLALLVAGCATNQTKSDAIVVGEDVCAGEAARIYFAHGESVLSPLAAQVVVRMQDQLAQCPKRRIVLVSISSDDGPPSSSENREERAAIVRQILVSRGVAENRITATAQGPLVDQAPKGPIGGVLIFTRP